MSENSLIIREKYISKLFKKIQELEEGIDLLGKVDRRILKKNIQAGGAYLDNLESRYQYLQRGGADASAGPGAGVNPENISLKGIQEAALIAKAKIRKQSEALKQASEDIKRLTENTAGLKNDLANLTGLVKSIKIGEIPDLKSSPIDVSSFPNTIVYNSFWCVPWDDLRLVNPTLSEEQMDVLLNKKPEEAGLPLLSSADPKTKEAAIGKITKAEYLALCDHIGSCLPGAGPAPVPSAGEEGSARLSASRRSVSPSASPRSPSAPGLSPRPNAAAASPRLSAKAPGSRKYYSNSVTSTDMPDNNQMFSETSFF